MPDKICYHCKNVFYVKPSQEKRRRFCSKSCQSEHRKITNRELRCCKNCGVEYFVAKSRSTHNRGSVCSKKCQYELARKTAEKNATHKKCLNCGVEFKTTNSSKDQRYCGSSCRYEHMVGENNPLFLHGGNSEKRGPYWQKIKRAIRKRDSYTCQHCGIHESNLTSDLFLHVHHIVPYRKFESHEEANKETNLITLCPSCHRKADAEIRKKELTKKSKDVKVSHEQNTSESSPSLTHLFEE